MATLERRIKHALDEARMIVPVVQVALGFRPTDPPTMRRLTFLP
jgi:hypothetical protein